MVFKPGHRKGHEYTYSSWHNMLHRVDQKTSIGRYIGVTVDPAWRNFKSFLNDMGARPKNYSLDRIDNTKGYCKKNCRWADIKAQCFNKSSTIQITNGDEEKSLKEWCELLGKKYKTIWARVRYTNWTIDEALCTPESKSTHYKRVSLGIYKEVKNGK